MVIRSQLNKVVALSLCLAFMNLGRLAFAQSQADEPLTLSEAVEIALAKNPLTRVTAAGRQVAMRNWQAPVRPLAAVAGLRIRNHEQQSGLRIRLAPGTRPIRRKQFSAESLNNPAALTNFRAGLPLAFHSSIRDRPVPELMLQGWATTSGSTEGPGRPTDSVRSAQVLLRGVGGTVQSSSSR